MRRPIIRMPRIAHQADDPHVDAHAHTLLGLLAGNASPSTVEDRLAFSYLRSGLEAVTDALDGSVARRIRPLLEQALSAGSRMGPLFGDLHHENILSNGRDEFYMIDPRCFMTCGIQAYDALHYLAYRAWKTSGKTWSHWMGVVADCQARNWMAPGCEPIARDFIDIDRSVAGLFYGVCRWGQLRLLWGTAWRAPARVRESLLELLVSSEEKVAKL
jgi:hypothetical protein